MFKNITIMEVTIDEIFKVIFSENWRDEDYPEFGTIAYEIKNELFFEEEVSVELAEWIQNDGLGCDRPNQIDEDDEEYDPNGKEIIQIYADSYIDHNFKQDFLGSFYDEDFFDQEIISKESVEQWIESSIKSSISFFNKFSVASVEENGAPDDLKLNLNFDVTIKLEDLNPSWISDKFTIVGSEEIPERIEW